jgi:Regulator of chromosome condensation (RCC1) repeat
VRDAGLRRRTCLWGLLVSAASPASADASSGALASYYEQHMALRDGVAHGWTGRNAPRALRRGVTQVGVGKNAFFMLLADGRLITLAADGERMLMPDVARFAAGDSGWFAIDRAGVLWYGQGQAAPTRVADDVADACIGDSADYYVTRDGTLFVKGLAHRGQYGDGKLTATPAFVATARDAVAVRAHTGHAIHLTRDGNVMGTGGNRFGPLSRHGLGDKADRWGPIFSGAVAIATGSRHSLAIRGDGSLWAWGEGFAIDPARVMERVSAVAAGDTATIALATDGALWQWDGGGAPRRLVWP